MNKSRTATEYTKAIAGLIMGLLLVISAMALAAQPASAATPVLADDITFTTDPSSLVMRWTKGPADTIYTVKCEGGPTSKISHHKASRGSCIIDGLQADTQYTVTVTPVIGSVKGESKEFFVRTSNKYSSLPSSSVSSSGINHVTFSIGSYSTGSNSKAPDKYYVKYATNRNLSGARTILINPNVKNYKLSGLNSATTYYFEFGSYYDSSGNRIYSEFTNKYFGKTKVAKLAIGSSNCKAILSALSSSKVKAGGTIVIQLPYAVQCSKKQFFYDIYALESLYQPYFQRAGSNIEAGFYTDSNIIAFKKAKSFSSAASRGKKADAKINAIVKKAKKYKSKKKQVVVVNNEIRKACNYDYSLKRADNWNPYGCLVKKKAVCLGYSEVFYACMYRLKIPCKFQMNKSGSHIWNKVKVNGKWTHIDVTWNDCKNKNKYIWYSDSKMNKVSSHRFK